MVKYVNADRCRERRGPEWQMLSVSKHEFISISCNLGLSGFQLREREINANKEPAIREVSANRVRPTSDLKYEPHFFTNRFMYKARGFLSSHSAARRSMCKKQNL